MLPVGYALRNLYRDPARMLQTILGSALVVLLVMGASAVRSEPSLLRMKMLSREVGQESVHQSTAIQLPSCALKGDSPKVVAI